MLQKFGTTRETAKDFRKGWQWKRRDCQSERIEASFKSRREEKSQKKLTTRAFPQIISETK